MAVKYLDNAGTQYLVNKIKAIDGKIPTESQITTMITTALNTYKEGIVTIVESLPQTGEEGKLYLVLDPSDSDVYIIYTWEENAFKRMGSKTFTLTVDSALSSTSTNPVQNKVIKTALDGKANASHTHGSITNDGKLGTASRVVITGTDKKIGISTITTTQLGYLSGVTSAIQTQLDGKSATGHTHTAGDVAGLATVATTGSYNDLSDKPSINNATLTIQKNGSTVKTFTANASSNVTANITVPTKTSDLTNDSNFVDTSNSAVSSGITSAKVTDYDTHIADTDIHVTTTDKNKWNNQTYVFRYSSTALVASSTNSNTLLDNTDNLKVGDKVIDSSGVLFSITAIDTANSTFTIGTALIDLAQDSDVVHKSGNEVISGEKNFQNTSTNYSGIKLEGTRVCHITADNANDSVFPSSACGFSLLLPDGNKAIHIGQWTSSNNRIFLNKSYPYMSFNGSILRSNTYVPTGETNTATLRLMAQLNYADDTNKNVDIRLVQYDSTASSLYSNTDNVTSLGVATRRWSKIYGTEYYYGSNNVEFSQKFVTTDTNQTVGGEKTFSSVISSNGSYLGNEASANERTNLYLLANRDTAGQSGAYIGRFRQNRAQGTMSGGDVSFVSLDFLENSTRYTRCFTMGLTDWDSNGVPQTYYITSPTYKGALGTAYQQWNKVYANEYYYGSNNVEFSTKFVTTDTNQTISGNKTFSSNVNVYNSDTSTDTANIILKNSKAERGSTTNIGEQNIFFLDKDNAQLGNIKCEVDSNGNSTLTLNCTNSSNSSSGIRLRRTSTGTFLQPTFNNGCNLGTSGYRWYDVQTRAINGVEPSSLSLPNIDNRIDISSYITNLSNVGNEYTPSVNGWICIRSANATKISVLDVVTNVGNASLINTATYLTLMTPVVANRKVLINIICTSLEFAYFIPCQGNV